MPEFLAGISVEGSEFAARAHVAAGDAGVNHTFIVKRRGGDGVAVLPFADAGLPQQFAGLGFEGDESAVEIAQEDFSVAYGDAAIVPAAANGGDVLIDAGAMLPDERAGFCVESENVVVAGS